MTAFDVGEVVAGLEFPSNEEKWDYGDKYIDNSKEVTGETFCPHFHDFDTSDNVKWKGKCKFAGAGKGAKHKGVGASFD